MDEVQEEISFSLPLQGQKVEIHSLVGKVTTSGGDDVEGPSLNGKSGRVQYGNSSLCIVRTSDGLLLQIPRENLSEFPPDFDTLGPYDQFSAQGALADMLSSIDEKGYCVMQCIGNEGMRKGAMTEATWLKADFTRLFPEQEAMHLGNDACSKIVKLDTTRSWILHSVGHYTKYVMDIAGLLNPVASAFGFTAADGVECKMLRQHCDASDKGLDRGKIGEDEIEAGVVDSILDFVQRRRLCLMYIIESDPGSSVTLTPKHKGSGLSSATVPLDIDQLLIFRHDLLYYALGPAGNAHLIWQGWIMEQERELEVSELRGSVEEVSEFIGGHGSVMPSSSDEVHLMTLACIMGANVNDLRTQNKFYQSTTDPMVKVPLARWDHDIYFSTEVLPGKALCQHSGFVNDVDFVAFDNEFFGFTEREAEGFSAIEYWPLRLTFEALYQAGYKDMKSIRGQKIDYAMGTGTMELNFPLRFRLLGEQRTGMLASEEMIVANAFGFTGTTRYIDTACSASNVAMQVVYQDMRISRDWATNNGRPQDRPSTRGLVGGNMANVDHLPFIGLSQAHMLGITGRSKTYDMTANGYVRSEGTGMVYIVHSSELDSSLDKLVDVIGGMINQDGRTASLTAPSGPSQTSLVKGSLRSAGRTPLECNIAETHGTGTALGDPIEVGSLRAAMFPGRVTPLVHQAGKSLTGHLEFGAGVTGIIKNTLAVTHGVFFANCHLQELNSNMDVGSYPALFPEAMTPMMETYTHCGISSFGFGGTNCRTEIWGQCNMASKKISPVTKAKTGELITRPKHQSLRSIVDRADAVFIPCPKCFGGMHFLSGEADDGIHLANGKYRCRSVRSEGASYEFCSNCYKGSYAIGGPKRCRSTNPGAAVYIVGSWSNWTEYEEMHEILEGKYMHAITLGETRSERFNIVYEADKSQMLYPVVRDASARVRVAGPDSSAGGRSWLIDGSTKSASIGTVYRVEFKIDERGIRSVDWQPMVTEASKEELTRTLGDEWRPASTPEHVYSIAGSWTNYQAQDMVQSKNDATVWETSFKVGLYGKEEFMFVRNHSLDQSIYPAGLKVVDQSVPIKGPDMNGEEKRWLVTGLHGETVKIQLSVCQGEMAMSMKTKSSGERVWKTAVHDKTRYYIVGSHNNWSAWGESDKEHEMVEDVHEAGVFTGKVVVGDAEWEDFQIIVDKDWKRILHPHRRYFLGTSEDRCLAQGPDGDECHGVDWTVAGSRGTSYEIVLDVRSEADGPMVYIKTPT